MNIPSKNGYFHHPKEVGLQWLGTELFWLVCLEPAGV
jgi:hypothetical protein